MKLRLRLIPFEKVCTYLYDQIHSFENITYTEDSQKIL